MYRRARRLTLVGLATGVVALAAAPQALASTQVTATSGTMLVFSGPEDNNITIDFSGANFTVTDTQGTDAVEPCVQTSANTTSCPLVPTGDLQSRIRNYGA